MCDVSMTSIIVCILCNMGKININDKILIENLRKHKRWSSMKLLKEFLSKGWSRSGLDSLFKRIDARGSADRAVGSRRPRSARTSSNITKVEELICCQEPALRTHKSPREIEQMTGIARSSVQHMMKQDLALKSYKRIMGQKNEC